MGLCELDSLGSGQGQAVSRRMRWAGHVARMGREEAYTGFWWGKSEDKRPLGRPSRTWADNIKMDLQEVGCGHGLDRAGSG